MGEHYSLTVAPLLSGGADLLSRSCQGSLLSVPGSRSACTSYIRTSRRLPRNGHRARSVHVAAAAAVPGVAAAPLRVESDSVSILGDPPQEMATRSSRWTRRGQTEYEVKLRDVALYQHNRGQNHEWLCPALFCLKQCIIQRFEAVRAALLHPEREPTSYIACSPISSPLFELDEHKAVSDSARSSSVRVELTHLALHSR